MRKVKIGQIGIGHNHGDGKILAVRKFPELFDVVGVSEESKEWIEKRGSFSCYEGLMFMSEGELLEKCDAILIETDVWNLTQTAKRCVEVGKHIHMDKPANGNYEEYKHVIENAQAKNLIVQLGYMYRYNPAIKSCIDAVKSDKLGEIYSINAEMSTFHSRDYKKWLVNFKGGIMYILGSHLVDLIVYLLGEPKKVTSFLKHTGLDGVDFEDNNQAILEYDKALARVNVTSVEVNGWGRRQFVVSGSKGTIEIKPIENETVMTWADTEISTNPYEDMKSMVDIKDIPKDCRYDEMMQDFYDYIIGKKENPFTYEHELLVHKVLAEACGGYNLFHRAL
jgi:predicted dehydrogenase